MDNIIQSKKGATNDMAKALLLIDSNVSKPIALSDRAYTAYYGHPPSGARKR